MYILDATMQQSSRSTDSQPIVTSLSDCFIVLNLRRVRRAHLQYKSQTSRARSATLYQPEYACKM